MDEPATMAAPLPRRPRGRPRSDSVAGLESDLLRVALARFVRDGYGGTSMAQIIETAGVSKNTMYSRFASKEALFRAIMHDQIARFAATMPFGRPTGRTDLARGLFNFADRALEASLESDMLEINRLIFSEARRFPELGRAAAERNRLGIAQIATFIRACVEADGMPCRNADGVAETLISAVRGWYLDAMLTNAAIPAAVRRGYVRRVVRLLMASRAAW